jgi:hypothetical protein
MKNLFKTTILLISGALLCACAADDFSGAYRVKLPNLNTAVLNIRGDEAQFFTEMEDGWIVSGPKGKVSTNGDELTLDSQDGTQLVFKRNANEHSLECTNCTKFGWKERFIWKYDAKGPYDVEQLLKHQTRKHE